MTAEHRRWVWINAVAVTALLNVIVNGLIAWLSALGMDEVPVWGLPLIDGTTIGTDTAGTFFVLPFVTTVLLSLSVRVEIARGKIVPMAPGAGPYSWLDRLPQPIFKRALVTGAIVFVLCGPLSLLAVALVDPAPMTVTAFVTYKAILGTVLGLVVTPLIALRAMTAPLR